MTGAEQIAAERQRQIAEEGYDADHDDGHAEQLRLAAASYALPSPLGHRLWPWREEFWKPTPEDQVRQLVKAGALIAAAIDSLSRSRQPDTQEDRT